MAMANSMPLVLASVNDGNVLIMALNFGLEGQMVKGSLRGSGGIVVSTLVCQSLGQWFNSHSLTLIYSLLSSYIEI